MVFNKDYAKKISSRIPYGALATQVYLGDGQANDSSMGSFFPLNRLKRPSKQIFGGDAVFNLRNPIGAKDSGYFVIRPDKTGLGPESSNGSQGRVDARHANCAALVNFAGNAEMFQFFERTMPELNAPFGQTKSMEYRIRCSNKSF